MVRKRAYKVCPYCGLKSRERIWVTKDTLAQVVQGLREADSPFEFLSRNCVLRIMLGESECPECGHDEVAICFIYEEINEGKTKSI